MRILILGGYGVFGKRLARLLKDDARLTLILAGRSKAKAAAFAAGLNGSASIETAAVDRDGDLAAALTALRPELVVDATGPFQVYGARAYRVVEACIDQGCDYMDLADGAAFVDGVTAFDEAAKDKGITILSGVSTCPVLTACVLRRLEPAFDTIEHVAAGIGPSPFSGVGLNVVRALSSYAGKPLTAGPGRAMIETRRYTIAPPGWTPLRRRLFALVDTPEGAVLPRLWPSLKTIWFGAAPVPGPYLRLLIGLGWLVRLGLLPSAGFLAPLGHWVMNHLSWGERRGGMFVEARGVRDGRPVSRAWHLVAEGDDGPFIPSMGIAALVKRRLAGDRPPPGARPGTADVDLADYEALFATLAIQAGIRETPDPGASLYRRLLGEAYEALPDPIRALHDAGEAVFAGKADVSRGSNLLAQLTADLFGFPKGGADVPVRVDFTLADGRETWTRTFAGRRFSSIQEEGPAALLTERFGPHAFDLAAIVRDGTLRLEMRSWRFLGLPMPVALAPRIESWEDVRDDRFNFHVQIGLPLIGKLVRYEGWLERA